MNVLFWMKEKITFFYDKFSIVVSVDFDVFKNMNMDKVTTTFSIERNFTFIQKFTHCYAGLKFRVGVAY